MNNIIVWIDSSTKINNKIFKLNQSLLKIYSKVLFLSNDEETAKFFLKRGLNILSIEANIWKFKTSNILDYSDLVPNNINKNIFNELIKLFFYKNQKFLNYFSENNNDPYTQSFLFQEFYFQLINELEITHTLILNGLSLASFNLAIVSYKKNLNISFWENGLFPNSLFINKSGVNAFAMFNESKKITPLKSKSFSSIEKLLEGEFDVYKNNKNVLITLQVENDSNLKLFSPFSSNIDFLFFISNNFCSPFFDLFKFTIRKHPKNKIKIDSLTKKIKNLKESKNSSFIKDLNSSDILITVNSTTGFEAIQSKKFFISFGNSSYSKYLRFKYITFENIKLKVFIFNPNLASDLLVRKKILKVIQDKSLLMKQDLDEWNHKLTKNQNEEYVPYFLNNNFERFLFNKKFSYKKNEYNRPKHYFILFLYKFFQKILSTIS